MILFYSPQCNHCNMLIDNIKRYDKEQKIKLVSIHDLLSENIGIEKTIHSVPAFMILPSKELLFGKAVFDHLLLPGRGILSNTQNTRLERPETTNEDINNLKASKPVENSENPDEPFAYSLGGFNFSDGFSSIDENNTGECKDKGYNWDYITNDKNISDDIGEFKMTEESNKSMPSLDELKRMRDEIKFD
jgi:hypothetical protein